MLRPNDPPINCLCSVQVANLNHQVSELERQLANALADINILRCLLKAPLVHRVEDALLPESLKPRAKCAMLPSYTTSKPSLESLAGEILDKIASYIDRRSVRKLAHAVPYYKYISTAMFALVGYPSVNSSWPHFQLPEFRVSVQDYDISPSDQIFKVYTYCRVLQRNQGVVLLNVYPGLDLTYLAPFFTSSMELIFYFPKDRYDLMGKCVPLGTVLDALKVLKKCHVQRLNYLSFSAKDRNATLISKQTDDWSVFENIPIGCIHFRVGSVDEEVLDRLNVVLGLREIQFQRSYSVLSCTFLRDCRSLESVQFIDPRLDFSSVKRLKNALRSLTTSLRYVEFVRIRTKGGLCGFILECGIELELESVGWQSQILAEDGSSVRWEKNY